VSDYLLRLRGPKSFSWEQRVRGETELQYPASAPPLELGAEYTLTIEARGRRADASFRVASADDQERIAARRDVHRVDGASAAMLDYLRAIENMDLELLSESVTLFEGIQDEGAQLAQTPGFQRTLGCCYELQRREQKAERAYRQAEELARALQLPLEQALAAEELARFYALSSTATQAAANAEEKRDEAVRLFREIGYVDLTPRSGECWLRKEP
jgi:hypothetical protein